MSRAQRAAQILGWAFLVVGLLGFFFSRGSMEADTEMAPRLLGLFPVNLLHNLVHLGSGAWGVMAARSHGAAANYLRIFGVIYLLLVPLALVAPDTFGIMPIGSHDIWLHALLGLALVYFGFTAGRTANGSVRPGAGA